MKNRDKPSKPCLRNKSRDGMFTVGGENSGNRCYPVPVGFGGLTKLEYAAIAAMQGLLVNCGRNGIEFDTVSQEAVKRANSLFDELEKENEN